jgi:predicted AlkP superfamily phosphohydrolase/phosphomutase
MSDHGFGPMNRIMYVNNWLAQQGYIQFKANSQSKLRLLLHQWGVDVHTVYGWAKKLSLDKVIRKLPQSVQEVGVKTASLTFDDVDWSRTAAYSFGNFGRIFINLRGREPMGCIEAGEAYEDIRTRIIEDLKQIHEDGQPVVTGVWKAEEVYCGPYLAQAPDIVFTLRDWEYGTAPNYEFASNQIFSAPLANISANHRLNGMLIAWGRDIQQNTQITGANIVDMAPTILHLIGLPVPADQDGQVLKRLFKPESAVYQREVVRSSVSDDAEKSSSLGAEDEQIILERLENLGYV